MTEHAFGILPAAGRGLRFGTGVPKQYQRLGAYTVLEWSLRKLLCAPLDAVIVPLDQEDAHWRDTMIPPGAAVECIAGGTRRAESVLAGLHHLAGRAAASDWVLVHDAVRPCAPGASVQALFESLRTHPVGGAPAIPVRDSLRLGDSEGTRLVDLAERRHLWRVQTPQMFRYAALRQALEDALVAGEFPDDETAAMLRAGHTPQLAPGSVLNHKITDPEDLLLARACLAEMEAEAGAGAVP